MFKDKKKIKNGYTLMELIVASAIIAIVASVTALGVSRGNSKQSLAREAQEVVLNIRNTQNLALSPKSGGGLICFYGLRISNQNTYFVYYGTNCSSSKAYVDPIQTPIIKTYTLKSGIEFSSIGQDVAFVPPEPIVYFNNSKDFSPQTISLRLTRDTSETRDLIINKFGNIEIQ